MGTSSIDFAQLEKYAPAFQVQHVFSCFGSTIRQAGSLRAFEEVDRPPQPPCRRPGEGGRRGTLSVGLLGGRQPALADFLLPGEGAPR